LCTAITIQAVNDANVDNLASQTAASTILLGDNTSMSCSEVTTLIGSLGSPPVNLNASGSSSGYPHAVIAGSVIEHTPFYALADTDRHLAIQGGVLI